MSFTEAIRTVLSKYAVFQGRARRSEYWWWTLFTVLVSGVLQVLLLLTDGRGMVGLQTDPSTLGAGYWVVIALMTIVSLALLLPDLAVTVRRLHDTGRPGWWIFIAFVPLVGTIVLFVFFLTPGSTGDNRYGPDPKAEQPPAASL